MAVFFIGSATVNAALISSDETPTPLMNLSVANDNYQTALAWAFENDVLTGDGTTGDIRPTDCVKRAEILKMLYNVLQIETEGAQAELFSDTYADQWYADYVKKAREKNTIKGYTDGTFRPAQCVNRVEALKMALLEFPNINPESVTLNNYADVSKDEWYYQYASYAISNDLVGLKHTTWAPDYTAMNYFPGESMTREEFAEMLYRLKTVQDNNLTSYDSSYGPENITTTGIVDYNLEPEEFFDYETALFAVLDTRNEGLVSILDGYLNQSPAGDAEGFIEVALEDLTDELLKANLNYEDDLAPAFEGGFELMYGMNDAYFLNQNQNLLITVSNSTALNSVIDKMAELDDYSKSDLFGFNTLTNEKEQIYLAYTDDALVAWPTFSARYLSLQSIKNGEQNLSQNSNYTQYEDTVPYPNVGTFYFNMTTTGESGIFALVPDTEGLKIHYRMEGYGNSAAKAPYMYQNLPANNILLYGENYGFAQRTTSLGDDTVTELKNEGIIVSDGDWLNKGFALLIQDTESLIPGISYYFDATGYLPQAEDDIEAFNSLVEQTIAEMQAEDPDLANLINKDTVNVDGVNLYRVKIDIASFPQEELDELAAFADFFTTPLEFYYGITSDDYVVLALYSGFDSVYGQVPAISEEQNIAEGMNYLEDYSNGMSYVSVSNMVNYIDEFVLAIEESTEPMPADTKESYNEFMSYFDIVEYIITGEKDFEDFAGGLMFVKMN